MAEPMRCPDCGATMNRHAEKLIPPVSPGELAAADPVLGGTVLEMHACPACGASAARQRSALTTHSSPEP
jgi:predicted RNA-binding Zn-ribbon protein involved in translation (DUF1610 family)